MIAALARRAGKLAERIAEADGDDPASAKLAGDHAVLRALIRL